MDPPARVLAGLEYYREGRGMPQLSEVPRNMMAVNLTLALHGLFFSLQTNLQSNRGRLELLIRKVVYSQ